VPTNGLYPEDMTRIGILGVCLVALVLGAGPAVGGQAARQDVSIPMDDGVAIAGTLFTPNGAAPAGGWPAVVLVHGIGGNREQLNLFATAYGLVERDYVVLTIDARGHGQSGGLASFAGSRDVADARAVHAWLAARPDVADARVGAWGISYGGGIALNSLVAGVPWGAVVTVESWTDLISALMPQGLVKSGSVAALTAAIPEERRDPSLAPVLAAALAGNTAAVRPWALERSSFSRLGQVTAPVLVAPGRRDFLFGLDQGTKAFGRLAGSKGLYAGLHGHAPSSFPAADTPALLAEVTTFLDCHLRGLGCAAPTNVSLVPATYPGTIVRRPGLPLTRTTSAALPGVATFAPKGRVVRRSAPLRASLELFGTPQVKVTIAASGGWSRLVAVLTARTPQGRQILVGSGGIATRKGLRKITINLPGQMLVVPKGSRLVLTLGSSSLAQAKTNTTYLDLPMPTTARVRVGNAVVALPGLRQPVTK
jgi:pimeloyl-ACP methyl ester carboxylesterase